MKRKVYTLLLVFTVGACLMACDKGTHKVDLTEEPVVIEEKTDEDNVVTVNEIEEEKVDTKAETPVESKEEEDYSDKEPVTIVLSMYSFSGETIEEYIAKLEEDNPDKVYEVYDDKHYSVEVSYADYMKSIKGIEEKTEIDQSIQEYFAKEQFDGAFISVEYDDLMQNITVYVDREKFEANRFSCLLGSAFFFGFFSDTCQAYSGILPEDRIYNLVYIDNDTKEEIPIE